MRYIFLAVIILIQFNASAQTIVLNNKTKIYLIRHAEKQSGEDPLLTAGGNKRAGDLMRVLKNKSIKRIYVTEYRRTQNTGDSLRLQLGIDTVHYLSDTSCTDLFDKIKKHHDTGKAILIIGHSNTIPIIIRKLGLRNYPTGYIPDNEFDNLFLLTFKNGKASAKKMKYGTSPGASAAMQ